METFVKFGIANTGALSSIRFQWKLFADAWKVNLQERVAFKIFTDILLSTLPVPLVWQLQLDRRKRVYLVLVLSLGYL